MSTTLIQEKIIEDEPLAILGGDPHVNCSGRELIQWPILTEEDESAVLNVIRHGSMSAIDVTLQFEEEFAAWQGTKFALGFNNGTSAIHSAMFACGVGARDEVICPSLTYWASVLQCFSLGATMVFADVDPNTLCIDPQDIEHRITPRTKAIIVVHYAGYPCDMDPILEIAKRHNIKVIEDVSHAQGGLYKGQKVGALGDVGAMSLMSSKSFAIGEAGILVTDNREIYERAIAFGHYERHSEIQQVEELKPFVGMPFGGYKYRMHQLSSAIGRVQLKYYDERCAEIDKAMNHFWDLLEGTPGLKRRQIREQGSSMAGWYYPIAHYLPEELSGLSVGRFAAAVRAEGSYCIAGCNAPLHLHPLVIDCDIYGHGKATRIVNDPEVLNLSGSLPITEQVNSRVCGIPWIKHYRPNEIELHAQAFRKVALNYTQLLKDDINLEPEQGSISAAFRNN